MKLEYSRYDEGMESLWEFKDSDVFLNREDIPGTILNRTDMTKYWEV